MARGVQKIVYSVVEASKSSFEEEKSKFQNSTYPTYESSYIKRCGNYDVRRIANKLDKYYRKIDNAYNQIDKGWQEGLDRYHQADRTVSNQQLKKTDGEVNSILTQLVSDSKNFGAATMAKASDNVTNLTGIDMSTAATVAKNVVFDASLKLLGIDPKSTDSKTAQFASNVSDKLFFLSDNAKTQVGNKIETVLDSGAELINKANTAVKGALGGLTNQISKVASTSSGSKMSMLAATGAMVSNGFTSGLQTMTNKVSATAETIGSTLKNMGDSAKEKVQEAKNEVASWYQDTAAVLADTFKAWFTKGDESIEYTPRDLTKYEGLLSVDEYKELMVKDAEIGTQIATLKNSITEVNVEISKVESQLGSFNVDIDYQNRVEEANRLYSEGKNALDLSFQNGAFTKDVYDAKVKELETRKEAMLQEVDQLFEDWMTNHPEFAVEGLKTHKDYENYLEQNKQVLDELNNMLYQYEQLYKVLPDAFVMQTKKFSDSTVSVPYKLDMTYDELMYLESVVFSVGYDAEYGNNVNAFKDAAQKYGVDLVKLGINSKEDFELLEKLYFMDEDSRKLYFYYIQTGNQEMADAFLVNMEDSINNVRGSIEAGIFLKGLKEGSISFDENGKLSIHDAAFTNVLKTFGYGVGDGVNTFCEGLGNLFHPDGVRSTDDYRRMYIMQGLSSNEEWKHYLPTVYQFSNSLGNMVPAMVVSAAISYAGAPSLGAKVASTLMGLSAAGNSTEASLQEGHSLISSYLYGALNGTSEATLGYFLGKTPLISESSGLTLANLWSETLEEGSQEVVDAFFKRAIFGEEITGSELVSNVGQAAAMGFSMALFLNGGQAIITNVSGKLYSLSASNVAKLMELSKSGNMTETLGQFVENNGTLVPSYASLAETANMGAIGTIGAGAIAGVGAGVGASTNVSANTSTTTTTTSTSTQTNTTVNTNTQTNVNTNIQTEQTVHINENTNVQNDNVVSNMLGSFKEKMNGLFGLDANTSFGSRIIGMFETARSNPNISEGAKVILDNVYKIAEQFPIFKIRENPVNTRFDSNVKSVGIELGTDLINPNVLFHELGHTLLHLFSKHQTIIENDRGTMSWYRLNFSQELNATLESARTLLWGKIDSIIELNEKYINERAKIEQQVVSEYNFQEQNAKITEKIEQLYADNDLETLKNMITSAKYGKVKEICQTVNAILEDAGYNSSTSLDIVVQDKGTVIKLLRNWHNMYTQNSIIETQLRDFNGIGKEQKLIAMISSILGGMNFKLADGTELRLAYGHEASYYNDSSAALDELFADFTTLQINGQTEVLEQFKNLVGEDLYNILDTQFNDIIATLSGTTLSNLEVIDVADLLKSGETSRIALTKDVDYNKVFEGYDIVYQVKGDLASAIHEINQLDSNKKCILNLKNTNGLTIDLIESLKDNVSIRIEGGYDIAYLKNSHNPGSKIISAGRNITYTKSQMIEIMKVLNDFDSKINPNWTDYQKAKFAYEYMGEHVKYNEHPEGRTMYRGPEYEGLLGFVVGESTCQGFAQMYKELCDRIGIPCTTMDGTMNDWKGQHAFNIIQLGEEILVVDTVSPFFEQNPTYGFGVEDISHYGVRNSKELFDSVNSSNSKYLATNPQLEVRETSTVMQAPTTKRPGLFANWFAPKVEKTSGTIPVDYELRNAINVETFGNEKMVDFITKILKTGTNSDLIAFFKNVVQIQNTTDKVTFKFNESKRNYNPNEHVLNFDDNLYTVVHEMSHMLHFILLDGKLPNNFEKTIINATFSADGVKVNETMAKIDKLYYEVEKEGKKIFEQRLKEQGFDEFSYKKYWTKYWEDIRTNNPTLFRMYQQGVEGHGVVTPSKLAELSIIDEKNKIIDSIFTSKYRDYLVLADMIEAVYRGKIKSEVSDYCHSEKYFSDINKVGQELVAEYAQFKLYPSHPECLDMFVDLFGLELTETLDGIYRELLVPMGENKSNANIIVNPVRAKEEAISLEDRFKDVMHKSRNSDVVPFMQTIQMLLKGDNPVQVTPIKGEDCTFDSDKNEIRLNVSNVNLVHEFLHALHYHLLGYGMPNNFDTVLQTTLENTSLESVTALANHIKQVYTDSTKQAEVLFEEKIRKQGYDSYSYLKHKEEMFRTTFFEKPTTFKLQAKQHSLTNNMSSISKLAKLAVQEEITKIRDNIFLQTDAATLGDFIDAVYQGKPPVEPYAKHGKKYYSKVSNVFCECLANFGQLKLFSQNSESLELIRNTFGDEFYQSIDRIYNLLIESCKRRLK